MTSQVTRHLVWGAWGNRLGPWHGDLWCFRFPQGDASVPAGTRNHFALDVGVDRHDVPGAIDAFTGGVERRIDMAEVNGRLFLNNVSLGIYGDAIRQPARADLGPLPGAGIRQLCVALVRSPALPGKHEDRENRRAGSAGL